MMVQSSALQASPSRRRSAASALSLLSFSWALPVLHFAVVFYFSAAPETVSANLDLDTLMASLGSYQSGNKQSTCQQCVEAKKEWCVVYDACDVEECEEEDVVTDCSKLDLDKRPELAPGVLVEILVPRERVMVEDAKHKGAVAVWEKLFGGARRDRVGKDGSTSIPVDPEPEESEDNEEGNKKVRTAEVDHSTCSASGGGGGEEDMGTSGGAYGGVRRASCTTRGAEAAVSVVGSGAEDAVQQERATPLLGVVSRAYHALDEYTVKDDRGFEMKQPIQLGPKRDMKESLGYYDATGEKEPFYFRASELRVLSPVRKGDTVRSAWWRRSKKVEPAQVLNATASTIGLRFLFDGVETLVPRDFVSLDVVELDETEREKASKAGEKREQKLMGHDEL